MEELEVAGMCFCSAYIVPGVLPFVKPGDLKSTGCFGSMDQCGLPVLVLLSIPRVELMICTCDTSGGT